MISIEKLRGIKHVVAHGPSCPDGIASALIIADAIPDVRVSFMSYGTEEHRQLPAEEGMLFCDFTPFRERVGAFVEAGSAVLDHHPTQRDIVEAFDDGIFGENDKNECGAWLAYKYVWLPLRQAEAEAEIAIKVTPEVRTLVCGRHEAASDSVFKFAELAGVRDTWKKDDPRWQAACEQASALTFWGFDNLLLSDFTGLESRRAVELAESLGEKLFNKQLESARKAIGEAHRFATEKGTRVLMFQGVTPTSDAAEILEKNDAAEMLEKGANGLYPVNADIVVGFHYRVDGAWLPNPVGPDTHPKPLLQFSTRSHTGYDVGAFCKARGGGGHRAAAGFTVEQSPELGANPYQVFRLLLEEYEAAQ